MCEKKIILKIENQDNPYEYIGKVQILKDIIIFNDSVYNYIFDTGAEKLIKESKKEKIIIDFKNKKIIINHNNKIIEIPIKIIEKNISINNSIVKYKVEKNIIKMTIKEV